MTIKHENGYGTTYIFEVVEKIPAGFEIWNIKPIQAYGKTYIPICQAIRPDDKNCFEVNTNSLKAIEVPENEASILSKSASAGIKTMKKAEKTLSRNAKSAYMKENQRRAAAALPILERITA